MTFCTPSRKLALGAATLASCIASAAFAQCGDPAAGDCCAANGTPFCSDAECCNQICAADPFCCNTEWDQVCANAANASCAVCVGGGCELATPDFLEPEECGTDVNGGCNSNPQAWTDIMLGDTVQGTFWANADTRDTDWYRFTVTEDTEVTATLRSALPSFVAFVGTDSCAIIGSTSAGSCPESTTFCFTPGEYYVVALTEGFAGFPCGNPLGNDYTLELTGVAGTCGGGGGGSCGAPNGNDCCAANTTPGCSDATCCEAICAADPFCCESQWDQICANAAIAGCDPSACGGGGGGGGSCGKPNGNDCCAANTTPGCSDATCCEAICAADPFCCNNSWDQICADAAIAGCDPSACGGGGGGGSCGEPNGNDCCAANTTPGCSDAECCNQICAVDPFCCESAWDQICADAAAKGCASCAGVPGDLDGNGTVDSADLSILLNGWGTPKGDLNGDGTTDSADLSILLNNWGA